MPIAVTVPFVTLTFNFSRSSKVKPMGPTPWLLPFLTYFTSKSMTLIFDPSGSSKVKDDGANRKPVCPTCKCSPGSNVVSVTIFEIFRVKSLTVHLLTLVGLTPELKVTKRGDDLLTVHLDLPSYKIWARSRKRCSRYALPKLFSLCRWLLTPQGHPRSNLTMAVDSPWVLRISGPRCPTSYLSPFSRYFESKFWVFTFWPWSG